jgi:beta-lactamase class A
MRLSSALLLAVPLIAGPIEDRIAAFKGSVYLHAKNLDNGKTFDIRGGERVRTASTIKLPVMAALYRAVEQRRVRFTDKVRLRDAGKVSGSGVLHEFSGGLKLPIRDVMHLMIVVSDNTATNLIIDRITADAVNAELDRLGFTATRLNRKVRGDGSQLKAPSGFSAAGRLEENARFGLGVSTSREMVGLLEKLERGEVVSAAASKEMLGVLKRQQDNECIRRLLQNVPVANKSGALDALRSDAGIVYSAKGRIAMAITCDDMAEINYGPNNAGALLIADLAKLLIDELGR